LSRGLRYKWAVEPLAQGSLSPDGFWRWDGVRWLPSGASPDPAIAIAGSPRSWLATAGAIVAIIAALLVLAGSFLPYVHYTGEMAAGESAWPSVFNGGFPGAWGNAFEPILVILFALAASVLIIASANRTARAFASGALVVLGAQTLMMVVGYAAAGASYGQLQAGAFVGAFGSILLCVGGIMSAGSLWLRQMPGR